MAKSVDVRQSRAITPNITRKSVSQGRHNAEQAIPNDLMNIYNFKAENIAKDLMHLVRTYEYEPVTVARIWKEECGRYIECHGVKLKPLHEIGKILKSNGTRSLLSRPVPRSLREDADYHLPKFGSGPHQEGNSNNVC